MIILFILLFVVVIVMLSSIINSTAQLFAGQKEATAMDPEVVFPSGNFALYREVDQEFGVPWSLVAGIHYVQTNFAASGGWLSGYRDALNLPDDIWEHNKISREEYWRVKEMEEAEEEEEPGEGEGADEEPEEEEEYVPIEPDRDVLGDAIFTVGNFLKETDPQDSNFLDFQLGRITEGDQEKIEDIKLYVWLFDIMYGRPGWPVPDMYGTEYITSEYGERADPFTGEDDFHHGVDIAPPEGEPVFAFADGEVVFADEAEVYGTLIIIHHEDYERPDGEVLDIRTAYGHSRQVSVVEGMKVVGGQKIAEIGNEGMSTGPHVHFEVREKPSLFSGWDTVNPMDYLVPPEEIQ